MDTIKKERYKKCKECNKVLPYSAFTIGNNTCDNCIKSGNVTKRIRYQIPYYKKVYTVYQYRRNTYSKIFKQIQALALKYDHNIFYRTSAYRVLDLCYKLDSNGKRQHLGDEKHIFRYPALESVLNMIADCLLRKYQLLPRADVLHYLFKRTGIIIYNDNEEMQAELYQTIRKPIGMRLKANIMLLKCLHAGMEIEDAASNVKKKYPILKQ